MLAMRGHRRGGTGCSTKGDQHRLVGSQGWHWRTHGSRCLSKKEWPEKQFQSWSWEQVASGDEENTNIVLNTSKNTPCWMD